MDIKSLIGGIVFFIFGVLVCIGSYTLGLGYMRKPGPGLIFLLAGSATALLSVVDIIKGFSTKGAGMKKFLSLWHGVYWGKAASILIGTLAYTLLLKHIGFLLLTPFFAGFCMRLLSRQKWLITVMASILSTGAFYMLTDLFNLPISPFPDFFGLSG
jgi:hypothetical protein